MENLPLLPCVCVCVYILMLIPFLRWCYQMNTALSFSFGGVLLYMK